MRIIRAKGEQRRLVGEDGEFQGVIEAGNWALNIEREKSKSQREKEYIIFVKKIGKSSMGNERYSIFYFLQLLRYI